jgi:hypothetical protein
MSAPSATGKFWRKWPTPGASSPRMMSGDALSRRAHRSDLRRGWARDFVRPPDDSTPAPLSSEWPEPAGHSWCSPIPSTLWRSAGTRLRSACRGGPPIDAHLSQLVIRHTVPGTWGRSRHVRWQQPTTRKSMAGRVHYGVTAARRPAISSCLYRRRLDEHPSRHAGQAGPTSSGETTPGLLRPTCCA